MAFNFPVVPQAYNWWEGNTFRMPPLGQYARPVYAEALQGAASTDPGLAQAVPQAVDPRVSAGLGIGEMQGYGNMAPANEQPQAKSFGDFARYAMTGPIEAMVSLGGQALINGLAGRPNAPINNVDLFGLVGTARDVFSGGDTPSVPGYGSYSGEQAFSDPGDIPVMGDIPDPGETPDIGDRSITPNAADRIAAETLGSTDMYSKGGPVRGLLGPNPPGPDDGFGGLDRGEFVVNKREARKHHGLLDAINKGKVSKKKARSLLD